MSHHPVSRKRLSLSGDSALSNPTANNSIYYDAVVRQWKNHIVSASDIGALTRVTADARYIPIDGNGQIPLTVLQAIIDPATGKIRTSLLPSGVVSAPAQWWIAFGGAPIVRVTYQTGVQTDGTLQLNWVASMPDSRVANSFLETNIPLQSQTAWQAYIQDVAANTTVASSGITNGAAQSWAVPGFNPVAGKTYKGWARVQSADGQWSAYSGSRFVVPTGRTIYLEDYGAVGDGVHVDGTDYGNNVYTGPIRAAIADANPGDIISSRQKGITLSGVTSNGTAISQAAGGFTAAMVGKNIMVYGGGYRTTAGVFVFRTTIASVAGDGKSAVLTSAAPTNQLSCRVVINYPTFLTGHIDNDAGANTPGGFTFDGTGCLFTSNDPAHAGFRTTLPDVTYLGVHYLHNNTVQRGSGQNNNDGSFFTESATAIGGRKINCYAERCPDAGFLFYNGVSDQHIVDCTVDHSMADPFHVTGGSHDISFIRNKAVYVGDDASANIGYRSDGDSNRPYNIVFESPTMYGQDWGRGLSYGGCFNCLATDVVQDGGAMASFLIGSDGDQANTNNVQVRRFTITNPNSRRGQKPTYSQGSSTNSVIADDPWLKLLANNSSVQQTNILLENGTVNNGRYIQVISYGSGCFKDNSVIVRGVTMTGSTNAGANWYDDSTYPGHIDLRGISVPAGSAAAGPPANFGVGSGA